MRMWRTGGGGTRKVLHTSARLCMPQVGTREGVSLRLNAANTVILKKWRLVCGLCLG